ncbi:transposase [Halalkaliarchaeum desulfuricum]|uniref:Transposase n=1 Tax=Halalkaliarchaeum desulfuricum TaxID=2055893 RepID=A0A343TJN7_9EURY|nr:transposase [Halalkaliarchaeum desulfuricum]
MKSSIRGLSDRHHLKETYDVEYSIPSCRRLLKEAGLSYQKPRPENAKAEPEDREEFDETLKKKRREMDATVVCIDQTKTSVNGDTTQAWFQRNSRPSVELSGLRDWTCLLGAVTDDGRLFFSRFRGRMVGGSSLFDDTPVGSSSAFSSFSWQDCSRSAASGSS